MSPDILNKLPAHLRLFYQASLPEITKLRQQGRELREHETLNPLVEHNAVTREMHEAEYMILQHLCPDLKAKDPQVKLNAMKWVLKQPWGEDFKPSPIHKKVRGIDLGSCNAA
jgi:hypothetical protein